MKKGKLFFVSLLFVMLLSVGFVSGVELPACGSNFVGSAYNFGYTNPDNHCIGVSTICMAADENNCEDSFAFCDGNYYSCFSTYRQNGEFYDCNGWERVDGEYIFRPCEFQRPECGNHYLDSVNSQPDAHTLCGDQIIENCEASSFLYTGVGDSISGIISGERYSCHVFEAPPPYGLVCQAPTESWDYYKCNEVASSCEEPLVLLDCSTESYNKATAIWNGLNSQTECESYAITCYESPGVLSDYVNRGEWDEVNGRCGGGLGGGYAQCPEIVCEEPVLKDVSFFADRNADGKKTIYFEGETTERPISVGDHKALYLNPETSVGAGNQDNLGCKFTVPVGSNFQVKSIGVKMFILGEDSILVEDNAVVLEDLNCVDDGVDKVCEYLFVKSEKDVNKIFNTLSLINHRKIICEVEVEFSDCDGSVQEVESDEMTLIERNIKDPEKYKDKRVYVISDKNKQDIFSSIPGITWEPTWGADDWCNDLSREGSDYKKCGYPFLIYHLEVGQTIEPEADGKVAYNKPNDQFQQDNNVKLFVEEYGASSIVSIENFRGSDYDITQYLEAPEKFKVGSLWYQGLWKEDGIMFVMDPRDYSEGILASQIASYFNAPIYFVGESVPADKIKGMEKSFKDKVIVLVGERIGRSNVRDYIIENNVVLYYDEAEHKLSYSELDGISYTGHFYLDGMTKFLDYIIDAVNRYVIVNPLDIGEEFCEDVGSGSNVLSGGFCGTSASAPIIGTGADFIPVFVEVGPSPSLYDIMAKEVFDKIPNPQEENADEIAAFQSTMRANANIAAPIILTKLSEAGLNPGADSEVLFLSAPSAIPGGEVNFEDGIPWGIVKVDEGEGATESSLHYKNLFEQYLDIDGDDIPDENIDYSNIYSSTGLASVPLGKVLHQVGECSENSEVIAPEKFLVGNLKSYRSFSQELTVGIIGTSAAHEFIPRTNKRSLLKTSQELEDYYNDRVETKLGNPSDISCALKYQLNENLPLEDASFKIFLSEEEKKVAVAYYYNMMNRFKYGLMVAHENIATIDLLLAEAEAGDPFTGYDDTVFHMANIDYYLPEVRERGEELVANKGDFDLAIDGELAPDGSGKLGVARDTEDVIVNIIEPLRQKARDRSFLLSEAVRRGRDLDESPWPEVLAEYSEIKAQINVWRKVYPWLEGTEFLKTTGLELYFDPAKFESVDWDFSSIEKLRGGDSGVGQPLVDVRAGLIVQMNANRPYLVEYINKVDEALGCIKSKELDNSATYSTAYSDCEDIVKEAISESPPYPKFTKSSGRDGLKAGDATYYLNLVEDMNDLKASISNAGSALSRSAVIAALTVSGFGLGAAAGDIGLALSMVGSGGQASAVGAFGLAFFATDIAFASYDIYEAATICNELLDSTNRPIGSNHRESVDIGPTAVKDYSGCVQLVASIGLNVLPYAAMGAGKFYSRAKAGRIADVTIDNVDEAVDAVKVRKYLDAKELALDVGPTSRPFAQETAANVFGFHTVRDFHEGEGVIANKVLLSSEIRNLPEGVSISPVNLWADQVFENSGKRIYFDSELSSRIDASAYVGNNGDVFVDPLTILRFQPEYLVSEIFAHENVHVLVNEINKLLKNEEAFMTTWFSKFKFDDNFNPVLDGAGKRVVLPLPGSFPANSVLQSSYRNGFRFDEAMAHLTGARTAEQFRFDNLGNALFERKTHWWDDLLFYNERKLNAEKLFEKANKLSTEITTTYGGGRLDLSQHFLEYSKWYSDDVLTQLDDGAPLFIARVGNKQNYYSNLYLEGGDLRVAFYSRGDEVEINFVKRYVADDLPSGNMKIRVDSPEDAARIRGIIETYSDNSDIISSDRSYLFNLLEAQKPRLRNMKTVIDDGLPALEAIREAELDFKNYLSLQKIDGFLGERDVKIQILMKELNARDAYDLLPPELVKIRRLNEETGEIEWGLIPFITPNRKVGTIQ